MNMPDKEALVQVVRTSNYAHLFYSVFGEGSLDDADVAFDHIARAIAAYERSKEIQMFSSRFDQGYLTEKEQDGMNLFTANCAQCHSIVNVTGDGSLFTNYSYANIGVPVNPLLAGNPVDLGLGGVLGDIAQDGKFKVPTLRNVGLSAPYSHNGYFATLKDIVNFKNTRDVQNWGVPEVADNLNKTDIGDLGLTGQEIDDIIAFLMTLTDKNIRR